MLFSSSVFLFLFLPIVVIGYYLLKESLRIYFLMLASLFFYAWGEPKYVFVMLFSIIINYIFALLLQKTEKNNKGKILLLMAIAINLGILFYFKYLNFAVETFNNVFGAKLVLENIIMPIGISFFTFQGMSYVIDCYREKVKVQKNPAAVAFYISFFPQLIAGPIVRYADIEEQIKTRNISLDGFVQGAKRFIIGLAKKILIANNVGIIADQIFPTVRENTALIAWLGIICYSFQIFYDFSGYSDMAIGLGKMFGFSFLENFNYPYISKTVTEFWRRWHISLSSWFRDYIYIPIGGSRTGRVYANILLTFIITGFWHGASFNFIIWGLWYGIWLIIERQFHLREVRNKYLIPLRWVLTMLIVIIGWVFFRAEGLDQAISYLGIMFGLIRQENVGFTVAYYLNWKGILALIAAAVLAAPIINPHFQFVRAVQAMAIWKYISTALILLLLVISIIFAVSSSYNPFIYFRF